MEQLHEYVPRQGDDIFQLVCFGDGLSCERHNDAHMARSNGESRLSKLQGLQPQVQEFYKRMLHMQVVLVNCYLIEQCKYTLANSIQISLSLFLCIDRMLWTLFFTDPVLQEKELFFI